MSPITADRVWRHIGQLVTVTGDGPAELGIISDAALAAHAGRIVWVGPDTEVDKSITPSPAAIVYDAEGRLVTPGFVDSHTHLVWAGSRAAEFHERLSGTGYTAQLGSGRGILSTVAATRTASEETLFAIAMERLRACLRYGSTTVEVKTGYGLDFATEDRSLRVIERLAAHSRATNGPRIVSTFMGAHVVPAEYRDSRTKYVRLIVDKMLPAFAGRARFCDVFCEDIAFDVDESRAILGRAAELGYGIKLHANQLGPSGGALLAAELRAASADHLDHLADDEIGALRAAGVVATLLPGCSMTLREPYPDGRRLIDAGLTVALATDYNPGTCACENMQLMLSLACLNMGLTIEEALRAATLGGARALRLDHEVGSLEPGKWCDLLVWNCASYLELGYGLGASRLHQAFIAGNSGLSAAAL
jgi:imidazolonepropionase